MSLETLRRELHVAIDAAIDTELGTPNTFDEAGGLEISPGPEAGEWTYTWPGGNVEEYATSRWFTVRDGADEFRVRLAHTTRAAWQKDDRGRAVVFRQVGDETSNTFYPWVEFVETDDERYAATMPRPDNPRRNLREGDEVPSPYEDATLERSDVLFDAIKSGPSVRLVVEGDDEIAMVRHGYRVGRARGRT